MTIAPERLRRGADAPSPHPIRLVAGDLAADVIGTDLRSVTWRGREVVERVYMAVRDAPWNTIPGQMTDRQVVQGTDHFLLTWQQRHTFADIDLTWAGSVHGTADGALVYEMNAEARTPFRYSKIGLNIHHGLATYRGRAYRAATQTGQLHGILPETVAPQLVRAGSLTAMFDHFEAITFDLDGLEAQFVFEGDRFEMQDHRNWSDANFKTYGTPLSYGFPMDAAAGERMSQRITMHVRGSVPARKLAAVDYLTPQAQTGRLPSVGHRWVGAGIRAAQVLAAAAPGYLRIEEVADEGLPVRLDSLRRLTEGRTPLELVLLVDLDATEVAAALVADTLAAGADDVIRVVVLGAAQGFSEFKGATPAAPAEAVVAAMHRRGLSLPVFSGTDRYFNELNRTRPDYAGLDGVAFSLNPQVHAADDRSLMDNVAALPDIALTCRTLYPSAQISVGPVHLIGPNGPFPAGPPVPGGVSGGVDGRHGALFGAAWTVALLEAATRAGVEHVTLYDLVGPRGLAPTEQPGTDDAEVARTAADAFPLLWPLLRLRGIAGEGSGAVPVFADRPHRAYALVGAQTRGKLRLLVANLRDEVTDVRLTLPAEQAVMSVLDETNVGAVRLLTGAAPPAATFPMTGQVLPLLLRAYAVACVDVATER